MTSFMLNAISSALENPHPTKITSGVDFSGKSLKLDTAKDAQPIVDAINACPNLQYLSLTGNTLGVAAAEALAEALRSCPELKEARFSDMFTGRMKTEIPPALSALGSGMIAAGARLSSLDLSDNAFGPIGVQGLAALLQSDVCSELEELRLNNNGLGIAGARLLGAALGGRARRLRVFVAGRNRLENDGAIALANVFQTLTTLEEVSMPQNGIYHAGVAALASALGRNPRLQRLDLNDNTVGARGAASIARVLPRLKNLKYINFGDCLLKSKGVSTLAKAIRDHQLPLESVNVGQNEVGRAACLELVEALTAPTAARERLARVLLAGNSLGGAEGKRLLRERLGAAAELSDPDADSDAYETDSDESASAESGSDESDNSGEDTQHTIKDLDETLDTSVSEVVSEVERFLREPTAEHYARLGDSAPDLIHAHLQSIPDTAALVSRYVAAWASVASLPPAQPHPPAQPRAPHAHAHALFARLADLPARAHAAHWLLTDALLRALRLIKSEDKAVCASDSLPACYSALADVIEEPFCPPALRDTLRFFISSKLESLPADVRATVEAHPALHT